MRVCMIVCHNVNVWFVCYVIVYVIIHYMCLYMFRIFGFQVVLFVFRGCVLAADRDRSRGYDLKLLNCVCCWSIAANLRA